jgi:hypothetical protein
MAKAAKDHRTGAWTVTVAGQGAQVIEGFSRCGGSSGTRCNPGTLVSPNVMTFTPQRSRHHHHGHAITDIELTFCVPRPAP